MKISIQNPAPCSQIIERMDFHNPIFSSQIC
ncbi:hypothetical protein NC652_009877 [Populus alba x Populus x berolinensis]|nr:hypothetical protein NC652_009877 [Populus alba x Populus x berolinensis]